MNNTKTLTAIAAILIAATLVVGGTFAATSALAYVKKGPQDNKKGAQDNGNSKNGNTVTIEKCKQIGSASGFDTALDQECENLICTHPGSNATCVSENEQAAAVTPVTPVPTPSEVGCPPGTLYNVRLLAFLDDDVDIPPGTILCLPQQLGPQTATISTLTPVEGHPLLKTIEVIVSQPNQVPCNTSGDNSGSVLAHVESGNPGSPIVFGGTVCVKQPGG
jgi:hypothetical protein